MKYYVCDYCHFTFKAEDNDGSCPDCGHYQVWNAEPEEIIEYEKNRTYGKII